MATPIIMPKFGQMTEESAIIEWLKKEGDLVAKGDVLFTVETDKSIMEVESFEAGTLLKIGVPPGVSVPVQSTVGFLGQPGEPIPAIPAPAPAAPKSAIASAVRNAIVQAVAPAPGAPPVATPAAPSAPAVFRISPRAAALADDCVIDATRVIGTGP